MVLKEKQIFNTDRKKIREQWGKSEDDIKQDIIEIKEWAQLQKHLPETPNDNMIEFFLTNCKFKKEKVKSVINMYYSIRNLLPDYYENKHPSLEHMKNVVDVAYICPLPDLTNSLHRITVIKYKDENPNKLHLKNMIPYLCRNIYEIKTKEDLTLGEIFVVDFEYLKIGHVIKTRPSIVKNAAFILEKVWANRLKEIHIIKAPFYVDTVVRLAKRFFSKKLGERIFVHTILEDLFQYVPQELLPSDYGGKAASLDELTDLCVSKLEEYKERFDRLEELRVNEHH